LPSFRKGHEPAKFWDKTIASSCLNRSITPTIPTHATDPKVIHKVFLKENRTHQLDKILSVLIFY
jgi:hypothetical protein